MRKLLILMAVLCLGLGILQYVRSCMNTTGEQRPCCEILDVQFAPLGRATMVTGIIKIENTSNSRITLAGVTLRASANVRITNGATGEVYVSNLAAAESMNSIGLPLLAIDPSALHVEEFRLPVPGLILDTGQVLVCVFSVQYADGRSERLTTTIVIGS